jgi:glycosyltransferase involved in cell wall biosynthesis
MKWTKRFLASTRKREAYVKPRIAYVVTQLDLGGCEIHLSEILPRLTQWYSIHVFVFSAQPGVLGEALRSKGIPVTCLLTEAMAKRGKVVRLTCAALCLRRGLKKRFDVLHSFLPISYCLSGIVYFLRVPVKYYIMSRRSLNVYAQNKWCLRNFERFLHWTMLDLALGNSSAVSRQLRAEGVPSEKIRTIFNGLPEVERTGAGPDLDTLIPKGWIRIVYVANFFAYKGHKDLIQVAKQLIQLGHTQFCFVLAGKDRGAQEEFEREIQHHNIQAHFLCLGLVTNIHSLLSQVHWAVFPSHQEGFSNSLLEKMSYALPIVATNVGGNVDALRSGEHGLLVPAHRPDAMTEGLSQLFKDPVLAKRMGQRAQERVASCFTLKQCVAQYRDVYHGLLKSKPSRPLH